MRYIYQREDWPAFRWREEALTSKLAAVRYCQGRLLGRMEVLGFDLRNEAMLRSLTQDVVKSSEIEGENLDDEQVRSSIARRLGIDIGALIPTDRNIEGVVEMTLDATGKFEEPLDSERLFDWHSALFPSGRSGMRKIIVGAWRDDREGPMQVVSGPVGQERVHFQAPDASRIAAGVADFLAWFERKSSIDPVLKAAIAHLWFVTIHPFEDGNGRMARAVSDMALARAEKSAQRFYSMSAQIRRERNAYYDCLEATQKGDLDITYWLDWFLTCMESAIEQSQDVLEDVLREARFWEEHRQSSLNARQRDMLSRILVGFEGKVTSSKWAKIQKCSPDTALRDINDLINQGLLVKDSGGGRSTSYSLSIDSNEEADFA